MSGPRRHRRHRDHSAGYAYAWGAAWPTLAGCWRWSRCIFAVRRGLPVGHRSAGLWVYDADTERFALSRYGRDILWHQLGVLTAYAGFWSGQRFAGGGAAVAVGTHGALPTRRAAHSAMTPVELPPMPWSAGRRGAAVAAAGAASAPRGLRAGAAASPCPVCRGAIRPRRPDAAPDAGDQPWAR